MTEASTSATMPETSGEHATPTWRTDIQGLRALAVVIVILCHAHVPGMEGGFLGVDVFFVISGYVITQNLLRRAHEPIVSSLRDFYARRIRRIVPAASLALIVTVLAAYLFQGANMDPALLGDARWASVFAANFHFISTSTPYLIPGVVPSLVLHYWSLAVEEQFYFVWPLLLFTTYKFVPPTRRPAALRIMLLVVIVVSTLWSIHATNHNFITAYYSPFARAYEIAIGAFVASLPSTVRVRSRTTSARVGPAALVVLIIGIATLTNSSAFPSAWAWWPCAATAVLLWVGQTPNAIGPTRWLSARPMTYVGDISYPLYLYHFVWLMLPLEINDPLPGFLVRPVELTGMFLCAVLSDRFVERPIRSSTRLNRDYVAVALLLAVCVIAVWNTTWLVSYVGHFSSAS